MKDKIHPNYQEILVTCACGNQFKTKSTKKDLRLDICSACHPFYTGKQKLLDTAGRVDRFKKRFEKSQIKAEEVATVKAAKAPRPVKQKSKETKEN
jgi:large subunit ribosomal protein L31